MMDNADDAVFLLDPDYRDFKPGKSRVKFESLSQGNGCLATLAGFMLTMWLIWMILIAIIILSNTMSESIGQIRALAVSITICVGSIASVGVCLFGWVIFQYVRGVFHRSRLNKYALILDGEIIEARWRTDGHPEKIHVRYCFTTPDGKTRYGRQQRHRPDLEDQALPTAGTPVHILYVDQWTYLML